jgi:8-oxo-dGTP pyrophosphatase MutT (NUDIX family)
MNFDLDPVARYTPRRVVSDPDEQAAVLVPVISRNDGDYVLFTERSPDLEQHAGQMSFPGGGRDPADADLAETALREANEEVNLDRGRTELVGQLDDVPGPFGHVVRPYVARVPDQEFVPDGWEIVGVAVIDADDLTDPAVFRTETHSHPEWGEVALPYFEVGDHLVWGLTGRILSSFLQLTTDWVPPEEHV